jgi:hypothetical protein
MKKDIIESSNYKEIDFEFYGGSEANKILINRSKNSIIKKDKTVALGSWIVSGNYKGIDFEFYRGNKTNKVLIFGSGGGKDRQKTINVNLARILESYNFSTINFDIQNNDRVFPINKMAERFYYMIEYAELHGFKIDDIGIVGSSGSGLPAVIASTKYNNMKVLLKYPVIYYQKFVEDSASKFFLMIWRFLGEVRMQGCHLPYSVHSEWKDHFLGEITKKLKEKSNEFHIVHGDEDNIISWDYSKIFHEFLNKNGVKSKLTILKGAGHDLDEEKYFDKTAELIIDHFK